MNHPLQAAGIAMIAAPLILQFIKAFLPSLAVQKDKLPFIASGFGLAITVGGSWLLGADFNRSLILAGIIGTFGPTGFYEVVSKLATGGSTPPAAAVTVISAASSWSGGQAGGFIPPSSTSVSGSTPVSGETAGQP